jgi:valyl-tRNA synthetase
METLAKRYDPKEVESGKYDFWIKEKLFQLDPSRKEKYTIVIPPPNVTGKLHLGHAWDNTLQDILIRYHHSLGKDTLYLPGMDHAGIATQAVVESKLRAQGISRYDLGREKFLEKMWEWKDEYAKNIRRQWGKLGLALNLELERFTLDEGLSHAVKEVFVTLYREGLIYQGERIINWDPDQQTALSNIEVIHKEIEGKFYYFDYVLDDNSTHLTVATTRPETMFGDVCLVVHPDDERYHHLIGKQAINPANLQRIPILADPYVDPSFGTGVMKCTPAHDANDFAISERLNLARPLCINKDGTMNEQAGPFQGLNRFECRKQLVAAIEKAGKLIKIESIVHAVGHSERSDAIVEPYLSKQWFVKMKPLAQRVLDLQASEQKIRFFPDRFELTLQQWMEKVDDWCISRQLWWGHQIPAWYHKETGEVYVGVEAPQNSEEYVQDSDVLDTWFSSALWPFSTLGWPDQSHLMQSYFPTSTMVTGYDIIFFWVARMAFQSLHFLGKKPFEDVLIHGIIRDSQGRKMSKSLGNGVDPIHVIDQYGTDALRIYLASNSSPGQDTRYIEEKVEAQANYLNKIWNSARFILSYLPEDFTPTPVHHLSLNAIDVGLLSRLNVLIEQVQNNLNKYEIGFASKLMYDFVYDEFCSWYLEFSKVNLQSDDQKAKLTTLNVLYEGLQAILIMLHPFAPFITEEIYSRLPNHRRSIFLEAFPSPFKIAPDGGLYARIQTIIQDVRAYKVKQQLAPNASLHLILDFHDVSEMKPYVKLIERMTFSSIEMDATNVSSTMERIVYADGSLMIEQIVDHQAIKQSLLTQKALEEAEIARATKMLANTNFLAKAPEAKVQEEKDKLTLHQQKLAIILEKLQSL